GGVAAETASTNAAVAATRGQVVTYSGVPAVTFFFSSSGGHTENIENVWSGATPEPWLRGVSDPYDSAGGDPYHHWGYDLTVAIQVQDAGSWRTVAHTQLQSDGTYVAQLPGPGTYRVVYGGLDGPAVSV